MYHWCRMRLQTSSSTTTSLTTQTTPCKRWSERLDIDYIRVLPWLPARVRKQEISMQVCASSAYLALCFAGRWMTDFAESTHITTRIVQPKCTFSRVPRPDAWVMDFPRPAFRFNSLKFLHWKHRRNKNCWQCTSGGGKLVIYIRIEK